jgi:hypothetical protein
MIRNHSTRGNTKTSCDRVVATQNVGRTTREFLADSDWNNRVSERLVRGQHQTAIGRRTACVRDHGLFADRTLRERQNVPCLAVAHLSSGWFTDARLLAGKLVGRMTSGPAAEYRALSDVSPAHAVAGCAATAVRSWLSVASSAGPPAQAERSHGQQRVIGCSFGAQQTRRAERD